MKKQISIVLLFAVLTVQLIAQPVKPFTFSSGDPVSSAKINSNFDTIYSWAQGFTAHGHSYIYSADTRSLNYAPQDRAFGFYPDFKINSTDGLSDGGSYHGSVTFRPYGSSTDMSGGLPYQLGFTENTNLWLRKGASGSEWGAWYKFLHTGNFTAGTGAANYCAGNDSRLSDARKPIFVPHYSYPFETSARSPLDMAKFGITSGFAGSTGGWPIQHGAIINFPGHGGTGVGSGGEFQILVPYDQSYTVGGRPLYRVGNNNNTWSDWHTMSQDGKIIVGTSAPTNPVDGEIWVE